MERYKKEDLENLILEQNESYSSIGKAYGVSGAAIKKAAIRFGIPLPQRRTVNDKECFSHPNRKSNSLVNIIDDRKFIDIISNSSTWKEIGAKLGYKSKVLSCNVKDSIVERCSMLGVELNIKQQEFLLNKTKYDLFKSRKNWQSARSAIRKIAHSIFMDNNPFPKCAICGYSHHVEVAHIKAVSEFDDSVTIQEINSINNLIGLCPNHHWEYDNGILKI